MARSEAAPCRRDGCAGSLVIATRPSVRRSARATTSEGRSSDANDAATRTPSTARLPRSGGCNEVTHRDGSPSAIRVGRGLGTGASNSVPNQGAWARFRTWWFWFSCPRGVNCGIRRQDCDVLPSLHGSIEHDLQQHVGAGRDVGGCGVLGDVVRQPVDARHEHHRRRAHPREHLRVVAGARWASASWSGRAAARSLDEVDHAAGRTRPARSGRACAARSRHPRRRRARRTARRRPAPRPPASCDSSVLRRSR